MPDSQHRPRIRFGAFELDPASGELLKRGVRVRVHDKPLQLLMALLERPGETISRKELQDRLWPGGTFVEFENGINNAVSRLREILGDSAEHPRYIETLPRRGYRFTAPVESVAAPDLSSSPPAPAPAPVAAGRSRWLWVVGTAAVVVTAAAVLWVIWNRQTPAHAPALAVLPFVAGNDGDDSPDEYLAFGMTDALISELSGTGALRVISQTSTLHYKGAGKTLPVIARELGVDTIVEGSVVHEGEQVRITVQLIDARTDTHLWTQTYHREPAAALPTQRALAREVAGLIRARLAPNAISPAGQLPQTTPATYEAFVKGRYFLQKADDESMARARTFFEQAIAADPAYGPAHVGLSMYYVTTDAVAPAEAMARAEASARRALALDATSASAYAALAFVQYFGHWNWAEAERAFSRALELDPNDARTRRWHALYLSSMGNHATAIEEVQRAIDLDPVSVSAFDSAAAVWSNARRFDKVLEQAQRIQDLSPGDPRGFMHHAVGYLYQNRFDEAVAAAQKGVELTGRNPAFLCVLAIAQFRAGQVQQSQQTLSELDGLAAHGYVPDAFLAATDLWLRSPDAAVSRLQRAYERHDTYLVVMKVAPWFDPLRTHAGFQELLRRMNLAP
jgi:TolB-like protein/DNA-binding winged helix-turn-helix (wHTH) protein/Flp pilus assembly protein TadD